jgi:hypothetical protein
MRCRAGVLSPDREVEQDKIRLSHAGSGCAWLASKSGSKPPRTCDTSPNQTHSVSGFWIRADYIRVYKSLA